MNLRTLVAGLFLSGILCLAAQSAKATTPTVTFLDGTDTLSVSPSSLSFSCVSEQCFGNLFAPSADYSFNGFGGPGTIVGVTYELGIAEPGTQILSDSLFMTLGSNLQTVNVTFTSDPEGFSGGGTCFALLVLDCQVEETGGEDFGATIQWVSSTGGPDVSYTVDFVSDVEPTPEPGTLVLFGSGLISVLGAVRRKLLS
jgi:PEP-CTERM motif